MSGRLYIGTSGFAYKEWKGPFYPADLKDADMLPYYAGRFPTVEINYSFRRHPAETTLAAWRERTPDGFLFGLKAHQRITHTLRLTDPDESVRFFLDRVTLLGDRLGPILFQCPPSLRFDRERLERFLDGLPEGHRYAFEFRHPSWAEGRPLLTDRGAWCVAETDDTPAPDERIPAGPFAYLRLRKERYEDDDLRTWAARIGQAVADGREVFCYFKHEDKGAGAIYAERMSELVDPGADQPTADRSAADSASVEDSSSF
ncbi:MAG TPA: DUF72 domain-containing protein [Actinomycetota bacterium]|nr:DUF72 domain-containing protein [Actinomycetota bacterium]